MQYDMGMLTAYDYLFFKQGSEENAQYYTVKSTSTRSVAFFGTATYSYQRRYKRYGA